MPALQAPEEHQYDNDEKNRANPAGRDVTPITAVRPSRKNSQQRHYQKNDQYGSDHCLFPSLSTKFANSLFPIPADFVSFDIDRRRGGVVLDSHAEQTVSPHRR